MKFIYLGAATCAALAQPALAQDNFGPAEAGNPKAGVRIEARASYETPTVEGDEIFGDDDDDLYKIGSAFAFGGEAGFDFAVSDKVVLGPYATYEKSNVESCTIDGCVRANDSWSVGAHGGVLVGTRGMVYAKVGYTTLSLEVDAPVDSDLFVTVEDSSGGIAGAIGYEHGFGTSFYGRIEGGYAAVGEIFGIDWQRRYVGVALGARF